ncbi:MAG: GNAT family N-acetyltransferase [Spirochaetaceae bacterium]|nr:GNAT family N-acetyltransferase [Spirochaetaceae bacterium]
MELFEMSPKSRAAVLEFLLAHEDRCVALTERVLRNAGRTFFLAETERGEPYISGVISLSKSGTLLHCLPFAGQLSQKSRGRIGNATELFAPFFAENPIFCLSGETNGSALLENAVHLCAVQSVLEAHDYYRMEYDEERDSVFRRAEQKKEKEEAQSVREERVQNYGLSISADTKSDGDDDTVALKDTGTIIKCTSADVAKLLPLQMQYDREEVLLRTMEADEDDCRLRLSGMLRLQDIFADVIGGEIVAKAGTNAKGKNWVQLGGVFTKPLYRRLGIAGRLVSHAARYAAAEGKQTTLFVRELNTCAFHSYERAGFIRRGSYRIVYFDGFDA